MKIFLQLYTGDATLQKRIGCWALQDALTTKDIKIQGPQPNEEGGVEIEVECEMEFLLRWLTNLPKEEDVKIEALVDASVSGLIDFWELYEIISQIKRLEFELEGYEAKINDGIKETEFEMKFLVPVSYFMESPAETQTQAIVSVSKEEGQTKNEAPSTENEMLQELKALVRQSKSELDMLKDIALLLEFDLEDTKLLRRAYINYKALEKGERKQLRAALAPAFEGKRIDYTMKELKKLFDQSHPQTAVTELPDSQEVTAATAILEESSHTEEGQKGDGDDTSSEEYDEEEDPHT